jgi:ParB-like chromosome segregation protein Spo0J
VQEFTSSLPPAIGAGGIVLVVVLMVLRGLLVPRSTVDMLSAAKDQQAETWRALAEGRQAMIDEQQKQIDMLLDAAQTTRRVLEALPEAARLNREGGGGRAMAATSDG